MSETTHPFRPPETLADLDALDDDECVAGYMGYSADDPEPGPNRGRSYWWGWWCRRTDSVPDRDRTERDWEMYWAGINLARLLRERADGLR